MNITKRENQGSSKRIGFFEGKILSVNPDKDQLIKLLGIQEDKQEEFKEPSYLGEDGEGNTKLSLSIWVEDVLSKSKFNLRFTLIDKVQKSKTEKTQYCNSVGESTWVDSPLNLQEWFTNFLNKDKTSKGEKAFREAMVGEADLYNFIRNWLSGVDFFKPDTDILLDWKKLMRGNVSEINQILSSDMVGTVVFLATVRVVQPKDGEDTEVKEYQGLYSRSFLPGYKMKVLRNLIPTKSWKDDKAIQKFITDVDGEYGCKDITALELLKEYNPEEHLAASNNTISTDGADY